MLEKQIKNKYTTTHRRDQTAPTRSLNEVLRLAVDSNSTSSATTLAEWLNATLLERGCPLRGPRVRILVRCSKNNP